MIICEDTNDSKKSEDKPRFLVDYLPINNL